MSDADTLNRFSSWYKGTVKDKDPENPSRLQVCVPDVLGGDCYFWAESANPIGTYHSPPIDSGVWVGFQGGDPDTALWLGSWRGSASDLPAVATEAPPKNPPAILHSESKNQIVISSSPGEGMTLETSKGSQGPRIVITETGITLSTGGQQGATIELTGNTVKINGTSLTVTG